MDFHMLVRFVIVTPLFIITTPTFLYKNSECITFQMIRPDEPYCSSYNEVTNKTFVFKKKGTEPAYIDYVAVDVKNKKHLRKVSWKHSL